MLKIKLIKAFREALELEDEEISLDNSLKDFDNWDSLSRLSLIALLDEYFEVQISNSEFEKVQTIQDLYNIIEEKKK